MEAAVKDCRQKSLLDKKREVIIKLAVHPHPNDPDDVIIKPNIGSKTPARELEIVRARRSHGDQLQFDFHEMELSE